VTKNIFNPLDHKLYVGRISFSSISLFFLLYKTTHQIYSICLLSNSLSPTSLFLLSFHNQTHPKGKEDKQEKRNLWRCKFKSNSSSKSLGTQLLYILLLNSLDLYFFYNYVYLLLIKINLFDSIFCSFNMNMLVI